MFLRCLALVLASLATTAATASAATVTLAVSGAWHAPSSWDSGAVPTADDDVVVPAGRDVSLAADGAARSLTISGVGTTVDLVGHELAVGSGSSRLTSLDARGGGTLSVAGTLSITGSIAVGANTTLRTAGTTTWSAGSVTLGGPWQNAAALVITGSALSTAVQPGGRLVNLAGGTIERHTGAGAVTITAPFADENAAGPTASLTVRSGALVLGGGTVQPLSSHLRVETGGVLRVSGATPPALAPGAVVDGPGTVELSGTGVLVVPVGATLAVGTLSFTGGTLDLAADAAASRVTSTTGTRRGAGRLTVGPGVSDATNLHLADGVTIVAAPLALDGALTLGAPALLRLEGATTWSAGNLSLAGAIENAGSLAVTCGTCTAPAAGGTLLNLPGATLERRLGLGVATLGLPVVTAGRLAVSTGTLNVTGGVEQTGGTTTVASGATLGGALALAGGSLTGGGTLGSAVVNTAGVVDPTGTLRLASYVQGASGTLHVDVAWPANDRLTVNGPASLDGTLDLATALKPPAASVLTLLSRSSGDGFFAAVNGTALPDGSTYAPTMATDGVRVAVVPPPPAPPAPPVDGGSGSGGTGGGGSVGGGTTDPGTGGTTATGGTTTPGAGTTTGGATAGATAGTALRAGKGTVVRVRLRLRRVTITLACGKRTTGCRRWLVVRDAHGRRLSRTRVTLKAGARKVVVLRLAKAPGRIRVRLA